MIKDILQSVTSWNNYVHAFSWQEAEQFFKFKNNREFIKQTFQKSNLDATDNARGNAVIDTTALMSISYD